MRTYSFSNKAISDLSTIWEYTENEWGSEQAEVYYRDLLSRCEYLSKHPDIGRLYYSVHDELRGFPFGKHIIFYIENQDESILVLRVLHSSMDIETHLKPK